MIIHTVESGESLYSIGKNYGVTIEQLISANGQTVMPSLIVGQAVIIPSAGERYGQKFINGYAYPNITRDNLTQPLEFMSTVSPFSYGVREDGSLVPLNDSDMIAIAGSAGVRPILIITTLSDDGYFNSERASTVLSDTDLSQTLIDNILQKLQTRDYFGVDIDFEYIPPEYKNAYADFITRLRAAVSPYGYKTLVSLAPKTSSVQRGLLYEAHDYALLGNAADLVLIMTYEWGYTYGPPMAIAPIDRVGEVLRYAVSEIPSQKVLMGIPNYAYDWTLPFTPGKAAESMSNTEAIERARRVGAEIMFDITSQTPYYNYYLDGNTHIVWFEDARSVDARMKLLNELGLGGMSVWNIMNFYKPMWSVINSYYTPQR